MPASIDYRLLVSAPTNKSEIMPLLTATGQTQQALFQAARATRQAAGVDTVTLRGVIEISNYCQKSCGYCAIRPQNQTMDRYRMDANAILAIAEQIVAEGIATVFLQSGQDPKSDPIVFEAIPRIRRLGVGILLNLGEKSHDTYNRYAALGAESYILKFETSDADIYQQIVGTSLAKRLECAQAIRRAPMKLGTGNIIGLPGQTLDTLAEDILLAQQLAPAFVSSSPFIPNEHTPLESLGVGDINLTLNSIAICRLLFPSALIPAVSALEKIVKGGQRMGLDAGANVLTINFTPKDLRDQYAIYSTSRFVVSLDHARATVASAALQIQPAH